MRSIVSLAAIAFTVTACSTVRGSTGRSDFPVIELPAGAPGRLTIDGSPGVIPLVTALVQGYRGAVPEAEISMGRGLGSKPRIEALVSRKIDIALASHGLDREELTRQGLVVHDIALTPVVLAVNVSVGISGVSENDVCAIYTGLLTSWQSLGGGSLPVRAFARPESEVDMEVLRKQIPCLRTATFPGTIGRIGEAPDMVRVLIDTPGAFGVTTATAVESSDGRLRALALGGVSPSPANVESGRYRLTRHAFLVTHASPPPAVAHFINWIRSPRGAEILEAAGSVPPR